MAMPKKRRSKRRTGSHRASAWRLTQSLQASKCSNCGAPILAHKVCENCGFYKGKKIIETRSEKIEARKARRRKEKEQQGR
ncbi:MAG: 50S ribosomal protein L32 [Candidatus Margulisbacteria bacterium]|nr:50S ribosomal protein L32 [Candidatus Margulisiibacteriota bacterium]